MDVPPTLIDVEILPKTQQDQDNFFAGIQRLATEDPTFRVAVDGSSNKGVISGMSELQLEIIVDRLKREFNVEASVGKPQVAYKETLADPVDGEMKYAKQIGGRGQYGHVKLHVVPGEPGSGRVFVNDVNGGAVPEEFIPSVKAGIWDTLAHGAHGYPIDDVQFVLYDGSFHEVDSSAAAFRIAAVSAASTALKKGQSILLEPVMRLEVTAPEDYLAEAIDSIVSRGGTIQERRETGVTRVITARVRLADMFGYANDLRSRTNGRATYSMQLERYERRGSSNGDNSGDSLVRAPLTPAPPLRNSAIALPEPDTTADA